MTPPLVSVLIPAFNAEEWISDTLRSAIAQDWKSKEIIVVDDGSKDRTAEIASQFESEQVRVVTQKNQGAAAARNKAFSLSKGDYIQWLDADDILAPGKISSQMNALLSAGTNRTLWSSGWGRFLHRPSQAKFNPTSLWQDLSPADWLVYKLSDNVHMQPATWLVSRELTEAAGPWDPQLAVDDDGEYFCRVLLASDGVRFVHQNGVYYRASGGSLSYIGSSTRKMEAQWLSMQLHIRYLRSLEDTERTRAACVKHLQNWLISFYPERPDLVQAARQLALDLGGKLEAPQLSWKYSWIRDVFGWDTAKHAMLFVPRCRWSLERYWDKSLSRMDSSTLAKSRN
jgi:glycosyltransferase involved in cell wall biosynthesis